MISSESAILETYEDRPKDIIPIEFEGIKAMSFGFAVKGKKAVMRGPMVSSIVTQLATQTDWGDLDYLVIDMPPGLPCELLILTFLQKELVIFKLLWVKSLKLMVLSLSLPLKNSVSSMS